MSDYVRSPGPKAARKHLLAGFGSGFLLATIASAATVPQAKPVATQHTSSPTPVHATPTPVKQTQASTPQPLLIADLIGKPLSSIAAKYSVQPNSAGNVVWEDSSYKLLAEAQVDYVPDANGIKKPVYRTTAGFIQVGIKFLGKCKADRSILNSVDSAMRAVGLDPSKKEDLTGRGLDLGAAAYGNYPGAWEVDVDVPSVALTAKK